jgi:hypothetical protein
MIATKSTHQVDSTRGTRLATTQIEDRTVLLRSAFFLSYTAIVPLLAAGVVTSQQTTGPSRFPHVTDGAFTGPEWSDIVPSHFIPSNSYLYADQPTSTRPWHSTNPADTFMLMYDEGWAHNTA